MAFDHSPWECLPLRDVCLPKDLVNPRRFPQEQFQYIDIAGVSNRTFQVESARSYVGSDAPSRARKRVLAGDVIFATTRPYLRSIARIPEGLNGQVCSTGFCVLRHGPRLDSEWLFYAVLSDDFLTQVVPKMRGATYPAVTDGDVLGCLIPLPPIEEQRRIGSRIKECLERVDEIRGLRRSSLREACSLEGAVFGDFIAGHVEQEKSTAVVRLGEILVRAQYGLSSKANSNGNGTPILRMGNIQGGHLDTINLKHIHLPAKELEKYRLTEGDILFNRTNSLELVGKAATFTGLDGDWVFASYLVRLEVDRRRALPEYVTAVINSPIGRAYVHHTARRAIGMVNINAKQIQQLELPVPPLSDQETLIERLGEAKAASDSIRRDLSMEPIVALPGAIIHRAFAGLL
jgi:type I restriction enzyme S subunit